MKEAWADSLAPLPIPVIAGPTASGKTVLSIGLAEALGAEIVSADSRQVYRELCIGTARPSPEEIARVPHHFVADRSIREPFSAGRYAEEAHARIGDILARGRLPLVVGGSTLYLQALLYGISETPQIDPGVRAALTDRLERFGGEALFDELLRVDPEAAATLDPTKSQRIVRALEVFHGTGTPLSVFHRQAAPPPFDFRIAVLTRDRANLYDRINARVEEMKVGGLMDEVRGLLAAGFPPTLNALQTIGYREPIKFLQEDCSEADLWEDTKRNSRRYAKRQLTWFRRWRGVTWFYADTEDVQRLLLAYFRHPGSTH